MSNTQPGFVRQKTIVAPKYTKGLNPGFPAGAKNPQVLQPIWKMMCTYFKIISRLLMIPINVYTVSMFVNNDKETSMCTSELTQIFKNFLICGWLNPQIRNRKQIAFTFHL